MKVKDVGTSQAFSCQNIIGVLGERSFSREEWSERTSV